MIFGFLALISCINVEGQSYIDYTTQLGISHTYGVDDFGGGISFHDFDMDGWDDLTLSSEEGDSIVFYRNIGGMFERVYFEDVDHTGHAKQILWCDYDNDSDKDLLVTGKDWDNVLYINNGSFEFDPYILPAPDTFATGPTYGATFGDVDLDGDLDLFICNRTITEPIPNQLFLNNGDGTFTDVTPQSFFSGIHQFTFAAAFLDYNNDMLPDLYTAEDKQSFNQIYQNVGNGYLIDNCLNCGAEIVINAMNVGPGDYDNDGDLDIYITNTPAGNALLRNNGNGTFTELGGPAGVGYYQIGWCGTFLDYDYDKDLDLYVSGSSVTVTMKSVMYENQGNGQFVEPNDVGLLGDSTRSFSHAVGDYNNDGFPDIAVSNILPDSTQFWHHTGSDNNWVKIKLEGTVSNKEGIGSWIEVWSEGEKQVRYTHCGVGYLSQNSAYEFVGLGSAMEADSIIVRWLSGVIDKVENVTANQSITIVEGETITSIHNQIEKDLSIYPNPVVDVLTLELAGGWKDSTIEVLDLDGRVVYKFAFLAKPTNRVYLNLSGLSAGSYVLNINIEGNRILYKIIKAE
ncbi:MAG: FG-GAP-like repeat-containing protein [Bacteroidota bacterium]